MISNSSTGSSVSSKHKNEELLKAMKNLDSIVQSWNEDMTKREQDFQEMKTLSTKYNFGEQEIIKLNIGGKKFQVMKETLCQKIIRLYYDESEVDQKISAAAEEEEDLPEDSKYYPHHMLAVLVSGLHTLTTDESGFIFIDRDGRFFPYILNYLRSGGFSNSFALPSDKHTLECLYIEARFFDIQGLMELIEETVVGIAKKYPAQPQLLGRRKFDSTILSVPQSKRLHTELLSAEVGSRGSPTLLFRASRDGFTASNFHSKCDGKGRTVVIVKATNGSIFGGYAAVGWTTNSSYQFNNQCFIFSLVSSNGEERFIKMKNDGANHSNTYSIYGGSNYGPTFGGGHDLYISNNAKSQENYSNLGHSYSLPGYTYGSTEIKSYIAGAYNFTVEEYEVFALE